MSVELAKPIFNRLLSLLETLESCKMLQGTIGSNMKDEHLSDKGSIRIASLIRRHPRPEVWVSSDMAVTLIQ